MRDGDGGRGDEGLHIHFFIQEHPIPDKDYVPELSEAGALRVDPQVAVADPVLLHLGPVAGVVALRRLVLVEQPRDALLVPVGVGAREVGAYGVELGLVEAGANQLRVILERAVADEVGLVEVGVHQFPRHEHLFRRDGVDAQRLLDLALDVLDIEELHRAEALDHLDARILGGYLHALALHEHRQPLAGDAGNPARHLPLFLFHLGLGVGRGVHQEVAYEVVDRHEAVAAVGAPDFVVHDVGLLLGQSLVFGADRLEAHDLVGAEEDLQERRLGPFDGLQHFPRVVAAVAGGLVALRTAVISLEEVYPNVG